MKRHPRFSEDTAPTVQTIESQSSSQSGPPVESADNHVYFYNDIDPDSALDLIRELRKVDTKLRQERVARSLPADFPLIPVWLHIQSPGGYAPAAFAAAEVIRTLPSPVYSVIEGESCSGGTLLSMAAARRYIQPTALVMIHQLNGIYWGNYYQMQDQMKMYGMIMDQLMTFYGRHSKMLAEEIGEILRHDSWLTPADCLRLGIVDEVLA